MIMKSYKLKIFSLADEDNDLLAATKKSTCEEVPFEL